MNQFGENEEGVHMMNPVNSEYSLCGDAWDIGMSDMEPGVGDLVETKKTLVTCPKCAEVVLACREVRVFRAGVSKAQRRRGSNGKEQR